MLSIQHIGKIHCPSIFHPEGLFAVRKLLSGPGDSCVGIILKPSEALSSYAKFEIFKHRPLSLSLTL